MSCSTSTTQVAPTGYSSTDLLFPALHSNEDRERCVSKRKILFCSIAENELEGFRGPAETCEVMEVILQREQKEESIHGDTTSHSSREEVTLQGRTSPFPLCHPHTLNGKRMGRCNHSGCRSCQSAFWLKKQRTSLRFVLQLLPHALNVTRPRRRITHVYR